MVKNCFLGTCMVFVVDSTIILILGIFYISEDQKEVLKTAEETKKKATLKVKELENRLKNQKKEREMELKKAEQGVTQAKKLADTKVKELREKEQVSRYCYLCF